MTGWLKHNREVERNSNTAVVELVAYVRRHPDADVDEMLQVVRVLLDKYGRANAASAFAALKGARLDAGVWGLIDAPVLIDSITAEQSAGAVAWAFRTDTGRRSAGEALPDLAGVVGRLSRLPARATVTASAFRAGTGWARVPGVRACAFCLMLASRGAVYRSRNAAALSSKGDGFRFHDHCSCTVVEVLSDSDLPAVNRALEAEWRQVADNAPPSMSLSQAWAEHVARTRPNGSTLPEVA
ncbi:VG15 protein [Dermabacteraceae bacterium P13077]